jgi:dihydrofolate reductase
MTIENDNPIYMPLEGVESEHCALIIDKELSRVPGITMHKVELNNKRAVEEANKVARGKDIVIGGGVSTIRQFLEAGYIDEIEISFSPVLLGSGENLFSGIDMNKLGFNKIVRTTGEGATHFILTKD